MRVGGTQKKGSVAVAISRQSDVVGSGEIGWRVEAKSIALGATHRCPRATHTLVDPAVAKGVEEVERRVLKISIPLNRPVIPHRGYAIDEHNQNVVIQLTGIEGTQSELHDTTRPLAAYCFSSRHVHFGSPVQIAG
jgi:hypothetical protein